MEDIRNEVTGSYDASQIQVLEGLEAVRRRPGMYIGSTDERGLHQLVTEIVDNSVDEAMAGFCTHIEVFIHEGNGVTVRDNGRGIPVGYHEKTGKDALEVALTILHAGGKFGGGGYKVSGGLHGVGVSCVNALSDWLEAEVRRYGNVYRMRFSRGHVTKPLEIVGTYPENEPTGTTITFHPDKEIFHDENGSGYSFDWDTLAKRFKELSFLNPGVEIRFHSELTGKSETYLHKDGIVGYVDSLAPDRERRRLPSALYMSTTPRDVERNGGISAEVALQYVAEKYDESIFSFANNINTHEGGTHVIGLTTALTKAVNDYAREKKILKDNEKDLKGEDVRQGLLCVVSVKVPEPQFEGQTKTKLGNSIVRSIVYDLVKNRLQEFFEENPDTAKKLVETAANAQRIRLKVQKILEKERETSAGGIHFLGKLADCNSRDPRERELFLVEGDSAGGSAKQGRDRKTQAILPLRGKVQNVQRARLDRILENNEIRSLISAIGGGYDDSPHREGDDEGAAPGAPGKASGQQFDVSKIRYHKVIIMTDADVDGAHIRTLLLTFFYNRMRPLIEHGFVYLAQPPLYMIKRGKKEEYIESDAKLTERLIALGAEEFSFRSADGACTLAGPQMPDLLRILASVEDLCNRLVRQNVDIRAYFAARDPATGAFPAFRVTVDTDGNPADHYLFTRAQTDALKAETAALMGCPVENLDIPENPNFTVSPVQQADALRRMFDTLAEVYSLPAASFWGDGKNPVGTVTDSKGTETPVESLAALLDAVRLRGRRGLTVQRYKGLGEMDYDQLFDTTMDPARRKLLRVRLDHCEDPESIWHPRNPDNPVEKIFQTLMGDEVVSRRRFIEDHALMATLDT